MWFNVDKIPHIITIFSCNPHKHKKNPFSFNINLSAADDKDQKDVST